MPEEVRLWDRLGRRTQLFLKDCLNLCGRTEGVKAFAVGDSSVSNESCMAADSSKDIQEYGWLCDACGNPIRTPEEGVVQWAHISIPQNEPTLWLVHSADSGADGRGCSSAYAKILVSYPLSDFLGPEGVQKLFEFCADPQWPLEEILQMIRRLHKGRDSKADYFDEDME